MSNYTETARDLADLLIEDGRHSDEIYRSPAANPSTLANGTLLARETISPTVTPAADEGNTGDADVSAMMTDPALGTASQTGTYVLECVDATTGDAEVFSVTTPDGVQLANATAGVEYTSEHINFTIPNDGAADWVVGDVINLPVVAGNGKLSAYSKTGVGGLNKIVGVHTEGDLVTTSAGDHAIRPLEMGGAVDQRKLVISGSAAGVGITVTEIDMLQDRGIRVDNPSETTDGYPA